MSDALSHAKRIVELSEKATEGPWACDFTAEKSNDWSLGQVVNEDGDMLAGEVEDWKGCVVVEHVAEGHTQNMADPRFIVYARNRAPQVAQALIDKEEEVKKLREALDQAIDIGQITYGGEGAVFDDSHRKYLSGVDELSEYMCNEAAMAALGGS